MPRTCILNPDPYVQTFTITPVFASSNVDERACLSSQPASSLVCCPQIQGLIQRDRRIVCSVLVTTYLALVHIQSSLIEDALLRHQDAL